MILQTPDGRLPGVDLLRQLAFAQIGDGANIRSTYPVPGRGTVLSVAPSETLGPDRLRLSIGKELPALNLGENHGGEAIPGGQESRLCLSGLQVG